MMIHISQNIQDKLKKQKLSGEINRKEIIIQRFLHN
jgi:hypothetical protein